MASGPGSVLLPKKHLRTELASRSNRWKEHKEFWRRGGGLYCSSLHNSFSFCHFARNTCIFCPLWPSLSSRTRLSNAASSLLWTSKVPKKSNMSNKRWIVQAGQPYVSWHKRSGTFVYSKIAFNPARQVSVNVSGLSFLPTAICAASRIVSSTPPNRTSAALLTSRALFPNSLGRSSFANSLRSSEIGRAHV